MHSNSYSRNACNESGIHLRENYARPYSIGICAILLHVFAMSHGNRVQIELREFHEDRMSTALWPPRYRCFFL